MVLAEEECWARLATVNHGALATVHQRRGIDLVPVVFAVDGGQILLPVDTVKPKGPSRLQRLRNLEADDRCALLVDSYTDDWAALWWVRVHGRCRESAPTPRHETALADRFPQYRAAGSLSVVMTLTPETVTGWAASS